MPRKTRKRKRNNGSDSTVVEAAKVQAADTTEATEADSNSSVQKKSDQSKVRDQITDESTAAAISDCGTKRSESDESISAPAPSCDQSIINAVDSNTQLLQQLLEQVSDLRKVVDHARRDTRPHQTDPPADDSQCDQLRERVDELQNQVSELNRQNSDLASQLASSSVRQTVSDANSSCNDALCWEERKQLILQQMEDESFDAEEFVASLGGDPKNEVESPAEYLKRLHAQLEQRDAEIARREEELQELRFVLDQQSETRDSGVAIGAAAIAEMIDSDELVQQERHRLQLLQAEWEEKFRQGEIEASLERAKLSRERQELAKKQAELEEQLEHLNRESRQTLDNGSASKRRWLVKLGLSEDER